MPAAATKKHPGGRPEMAEHERRCRQSKIRLTIKELEFVRDQAKSAGLSLAEFVRRRALSVPVQPPAAKADAALLRELNAIGNNVNQIARNLNSDRGGPQDKALSVVQNQLRDVLEKVGDAIQ